MLKNKGFTLMEIVLVVGVSAMIFVFTFPFAIRYYRSQITDDVRSNIIDSLERARLNAVLQKNDSNFGLSLSAVPNNYVIFQGTSYATRDATQDEVYSLIQDINFSGLTDVVFSKLSGLPDATGTISVIYGDITKNISIDDYGYISKAN